MEPFAAIWCGMLFICAFVVAIGTFAPRLSLRFSTVRPPALRAQLGASNPHRYGWVLKGEGKGSASPTLRVTAHSAWALYVAHQITHWGLIAWAQSTDLTYKSDSLHAVNYWALAINGIFVMAHLVQTHLYYDGLAQDVPEYSAQMAVLFMLSIIAVMENPRRGLVWGFEAPINEAATALFKKCHGYFFSWAIIYTFWFHPADKGLGLQSGFAYLLCILLQGSLFFTSAHLDHKWRFVQEAGLFIHASFISLEQARAGSGWKIFKFFSLGTASIVVLSSMHGIGLGRTHKLCVVALLGVAATIAHWEEPLKIMSLIAFPAGVLGIYLALVVAIAWGVTLVTSSAKTAGVLCTVAMISVSVIHGFYSDWKAQRAAALKTAD